MTQNLILTYNELKSVKTALLLLKTRAMKLTSNRHLTTSEKMLENLNDILEKYHKPVPY